MNQPTETSIERMRPTEMQAIVMAMAQVFVEIEGEAAAQKLGVYAEEFLALLETADEGDPNQPSIFDCLDEEAIVEELRERNEG